MLNLYRPNQVNKLNKYSFCLSYSSIEGDCKKKLKCLKDKMREICSKLPKTASGQPAFQSGEEIVRWQYYKPLLFMKDQFIGRQLSGSFHDNFDASTSRQITDVNTEEDEDDEEIGDYTPTTAPFTQQSAKKRPQESSDPRPCSSKKLKQTEQFLELEREKLNSINLLMKDDGPKDECVRMLTF